MTNLALSVKSLFLLFLVTLAIALVPLAQAKPPKNQAILGEATYVTMPLRQLAHPVLLYVDKEHLLKRGYTVEQVLEKYGFASHVDGEAADAYLEVFKTAYVDGNGGIGMNGNFGSGRAAIIDEEWQIKGSGRTPMVNPNADADHRNGASLLPEAIHEAIWSNLLAAELPYGAYKVVAIIATGSMVTVDGREGEPRVLIIREDPVRPGHFVINSNAEKLNAPRDPARVQDAMTHLVAALPQPPGLVARDELARFRSGIFEFIDRQATQHAYAWAHSLFHGGTSPTNAGLDGRMLDFGTFSAYDGYPRVRILHDDGFMGDTDVYKRDLLKDVRDSWLRTLPPHLLAALPSEKEWFDRFEAAFQKTRQTEMLRLAGAFSELKDVLLSSRQGQLLAKNLIALAENGNENGIEFWKGGNPFGQGNYNVGKILDALAGMTLEELDSETDLLKGLIPTASVRKKFVTRYKSLFKLQRKLALAHGVSSEAEARYRKFAAGIRNKKMTAVFRQEANEQHIWKILEDYKKDHDPRPTQQYIEQVISEARRDFREAPPFSIVLNETKAEDKTERNVFDARANQTIRIETQPCEPLLLRAQ